MPFKSIFYSSVFLFTLTVHSKNINPETITTTDSMGYVQLFDFTEKWYAPGSNATRMQWEEDFIKLGKQVENTPERYVKNVLGWFELDGSSKELLYYKSSYVWNSGTFANMYLRYSSEDDNYTKQSLREAYLFTHISRSDNNIQRLWEIFKPLVKLTLAPYMRTGKQERGYVQGLTDTWSCILSKKGYKKKLESIYAKLDAEKPESYTLIQYVRPLVCEDIEQRFKRQSEYYDELADVGWIYSFWVRRYHEGNAAITLSILEEMLTWEDA